MMQHKVLGTQIKDLDAHGRVIVAANAIGNKDADNDISMEGSFNKTLSEHFKRVKWFLNHDTTILLGVPIQGKQSGKYLEIEGQLNMKKQISRDTYEDYKLYAEHGRSLEHSVGVNAIKWDEDKETKTRKVTEWKLWEYSTLTNWGANADTPLLSIKSLEKIEDGIQWLDLMLRKGNYTDERFLQIETQIQVLKSLLNEPDETTQKEEPRKRDWNYLRTIKF